VQRLPTDSGLRPIDVVTHQNFAAPARMRSLKSAEDPNRLRAIGKGDFVVLQISVTNCASYAWNFVVGQVICDVQDLDTTDPETVMEFQIFRPATMNKLDSKFVPWMGDTNELWKGTFSRGHVKALVDMQVKGKKLTSKSQKLIQEIFLEGK
jgi:hypothetical protein